MLTIKHNKKEIEMKFGLGELREINKRLGIEVEGISIGYGLSLAIPGIQEADPIVLADVILACTSKQKGAPKTDEEVEQILVDRIEKDGGLDKLVDEILEEVGKRPLIQNELKKLQQ